VNNHQGFRANILVIDDESGIREGCRRALTSVGHTVDTVTNLDSALARLRTADYDLFLIDAMLPDGSGLDLLEPILDADPLATCIIMTGFGSVEMAVRAIRHGAYNYLSKPFTSDELTMAVDQGLEYRRLRAVEAQAAELELARAELLKLDEVKSQLMLKVAHELRAPAAAVQSYVNLMLGGYISEDERASTLTRIQARLQEMLDMTSDLLELAQLKQARDLPLADAVPQDMAAILEEVCDLMGQQAREKGLDFGTDVQDRPVVIADREHLWHIWTNLISNAIKYTPGGGQVSVRLQADERSLTGTVEDSGIGITEKDMSHVFQDFFRTDEAKASGEIGTGLGLSIVKQIVESYGGSIQVTSEPGRGSRFSFTLPLEPHPGPGSG
jgi:signal transduction histidine kinase